MVLDHNIEEGSIQIIKVSMTMRAKENLTFCKC